MINKVTLNYHFHTFDNYAFVFSVLFCSGCWNISMFHINHILRTSHLNKGVVLYFITVFHPGVLYFVFEFKIRKAFYCWGWCESVRKHSTRSETSSHADNLPFLTPFFMKIRWFDGGQQEVFIEAAWLLFALNSAGFPSFFTALLYLICLSRSGRRSANVLELVLRWKVPSLSTGLTA